MDRAGRRQGIGGGGDADRGGRRSGCGRRWTWVKFWWRGEARRRPSACRGREESGAGGRGEDNGASGQDTLDGGAWADRRWPARSRRCGVDSARRPGIRGPYRGRSRPRARRLRRPPRRRLDRPRHGGDGSGAHRRLSPRRVAGRRRPAGAPGAPPRRARPDPRHPPGPPLLRPRRAARRAGDGVGRRALVALRHRRPPPGGGAQRGRRHSPRRARADPGRADRGSAAGERPARLPRPRGPPPPRPSDPRRRRGDPGRGRAVGQGPRRLDSIVRAWRRARHVEEVRYYCPPGVVRRGVERAIERTHAGEKVRIEELPR